MMLKIKFTRKWWNKYAKNFDAYTNNEVQDHLRDWVKASFTKVRPSDTDKFEALLLYDAKNKASKKRIR